MSSKFLCGVPGDQCCGYYSVTNKSLGNSVKTHPTAEEAFACHAKHLINQKFIQIGAREFVDPKTGYVRVLTKKSKFGAKLRQGKSGEKSTSSGRRFMPGVMGKACKAGTVVST